MVSNYTPNNNSYRIDKLENVVYLINGESIINIDNGAAYVHGISPTAMTAIRTSSISLEDNDELNERYSFTHRLTFDVLGYANVNLLDNKYYFIVKDKNNIFWLVNPQFPSKIQHTFEATETECHTTFTASTVSNHPLLEVKDIIGTVPSIPELECGYVATQVASLLLNEKDYTNANGENITYTNDGFKSVVFQRNSLTFNESFDGENVTQSISFKILLSDYKSSWHYNLLEFIHNSYCGILQFKNGDNFAFGLTNGLQPSFELNGSDEEINSITVSMSGTRASYASPSGYIHGYISGVTNTFWYGTAENDAFECVDDGVAIYELMYEADAFGNRTGRYRCLEGMEERFEDYNIIGTFALAGAERFNTIMCHYEDTCSFNTSFYGGVLTSNNPSTSFTIDSNSSWSISTNSSQLQISPSYGSAGQTNVTITATSFNLETAMVTFTYCDGRTMTQRLTVSPANSCFVDGVTSYTINADEQTISVPYSCCIERVLLTSSRPWVKSVTFGNGRIVIKVKTNDTFFQRSADFNIYNCDGLTNTLRVTQERWYTQWIPTQGHICSGGSLYSTQTMYSGTTPNNITTPTNKIEPYELIEENSQECGYNGIYRWVDSETTYCLDGFKFNVMQHEVSYDEGETWESIEGDTMLSGGVLSSDCEAEYEYRWNMTPTNPWQCGNGEAGSGQTFYALNYFTTVARGQGTITFSGATTAQTLSYSLNNGGTWQPASSNVSVSVTNGTVVMWRGVNGDNKIGNFSATVQFEVRGNIMSLLYGAEYQNQFTFPSTNVFNGLFSGSSVTSAENLILPATALTQSCYSSMFMSCHNLVQAPQLPSETLATDCYGQMFKDCRALTIPPTQLLATVGAANSYREMFIGCTALVDAPEIKMNTAAMNCCTDMFNGCTSLRNIPNLTTTTLSTSCFSNMFSGCTSLQSAPDLPATALTTSCYSNMFYGCSSLNYVKMLATSIPSGSLSNWLQGTAQNGVFIKDENATIGRGTSGIPLGWSINTPKTD